MPSEKIQQALNTINSLFKKPVVTTVDGAMAEKLAIKKIPTGSLKLDRALGGGVPRGGAIEFYGPEGGGKSTLALSIIAQAQKMGLACCYADLENRFNPNWAEVNGVDLENLIVYAPLNKSGDDMLQEFKDMIISKCLGVMVIDSLPGLVPKQRMEKSIGEKTYSGFSGILSTFSEVMMGSGFLRDSGTCLIGINQIRDNIGVSFGPQTRTPGGHAWRHLCWQRVCFTKIKDIKIGDDPEPIGCELQFFVKKNQVGSPGTVGTCELFGQAGINTFAEVYDLAIYYGIIVKKGKWNYYMDVETGEMYTDINGNEYKWDGANKTKQAIMEDELLFEELLCKVQERNNGNIYA